VARSVPAVVRALDVLEMFLDGRGSFSAPEVAAALDLPRTTTHELLATLTEREYVERMPDNTHRFRLGVRVYELGSVYADALDVVRDAQPLVDDVAARCGETCQLGLLDGRDVVYVARARSALQPPREAASPGVSPPAGRRVPAVRTAAGRVLLAHLPRADLDRRLAAAGTGPVTTVQPGAAASTAGTADPGRVDVAAAERVRLWRELSTVVARGVGSDADGADRRSRAIAAPVRDHAGRVVAALEIRVPVERWEGPRSLALESLVRRAAARASTRLGYRPPRTPDTITTAGPAPVTRPGTAGPPVATRPAATGPLTGHPSLNGHVTGTTRERLGAPLAAATVPDRSATAPERVTSPQETASALSGRPTPAAQGVAGPAGRAQPDRVGTAHDGQPVADPVGPGQQGSVTGPATGRTAPIGRPPVPPATAPRSRPVPLTAGGRVGRPELRPAAGDPGPWAPPAHRAAPGVSRPPAGVLPRGLAPGWPTVPRPVSTAPPGSSAPRWGAVAAPSGQLSPLPDGDADRDPLPAGVVGAPPAIPPRPSPDPTGGERAGTPEPGQG